MNIKLILSVLNLICVTRIDGVKQEIGSGQIDPNCAQAGQTCSSDCTAVLVCVATGAPPVSVDCPANLLCINGICSESQGACTANPSFICTSIGSFPDPTDCTQYHVCLEEGTDSILQPCPTGMIYDSKLMRCRIGRVDHHSSKKICKTINCNKKPNGIIVYPANPSYYVICRNDGNVQQMTVSKCNVDQVYDISEGRCVFKCKKSGEFPDSADCTVYYTCVGFIKYTSIQSSCPTGTYFIVSQGVSSCTPSSTHCPPGSVVEVPPIGLGNIDQAAVQTPPQLPTQPPPQIPTQPPPPPSYTLPPQHSSPLPTPPTPTSLSSQMAEQITEQMTETISTSPVFPFYTLWKHKGKFSIRLGKL